MQYATVLCGLRDFAPPAQAGRGRRGVQNEEELSDAVRANQSTSTRLVARGVGISYSEVRCVLHGEYLAFSCITYAKAAAKIYNDVLQFSRRPLTTDDAYLPFRTLWSDEAE
jgi:hypothetical protein